MIKRRARRLSLAVLLVIVLVMLAAVPAWAISYSATVTLGETAGNSYSTYPVTLMLNNSYMASNGYMSSSGMDQQITIGGVAVPSMVASDRTNYISDITGLSTIYPQLTLGNTPATTMPVIPGYGGYVSIADNAALYPPVTFGVSNFSMVFSGYFNMAAGTGNYAIQKFAAISVDNGVTVPGDITLSINGTSTFGTASIPLTTGWHTIFFGGNPLNHTYFISDSIYDLNGDGVITLSDEQVIENWILLDPGVYYYPYDFNHDGTISVADITAFENQITNQGLIGTAVHTATVSSLGGITTNSNAWQIDLVNAMPYFNYFRYAVNNAAAETILYQPVTMILSTALPNTDSAGAYPGVFTFGTNSAGIVSSVGPLNGQNSNVTPASPAGQVVSSGGLNTENSGQSTNLLTPYFQPWATLTNIPLIAFFLILATIIQLALLVWVLRATQNQLIAALVMILTEVVLYKLGIYELWFVIVTVLVCFAIVVYERKPVL